MLLLGKNARDRCVCPYEMYGISSRDISGTGCLDIEKMGVGGQ